MATYHVYGLGAALVDTEIEIDDAFLSSAGIDKGVMTLVDEDRQQEILTALSANNIASSRASGGSACNSVIAASYFGANTFFSGKVANDDNGKFFINDLNAAGVDFHNAEADHGTTGKCLVMITPDAERTMNTFLGISEDLSHQEIDFDAIKQSEYLYIEGYLVTSDSRRVAVVEAREYAQANGVKIALSLSDPFVVDFFIDGLNEIAGNKLDIIFCNKDEALQFTKTTSIEAAIEVMKTRSNAFAITSGSEGAWVYDGQELIHSPAISVQAVDTNGAGDMFAGAFLYAITHGHSFEAAATLANSCAAKVVSQYGPRLAADDHQKLKAAWENS